MTMRDVPFEILRCAWPLPVVEQEGRWVSEPEWSAPSMPAVPVPHWELIDGEPCWTVDWREFFRIGVRHPPNAVCGDMCGFHVVFQIRTRQSGTLVIWADDGCVIRRNGETLHTDRDAHPLVKTELTTTAGDVLDVAQWQRHNDWMWAGRIRRADPSAPDVERVFLSRLSDVRARLDHPNGPPLKMLTHGEAPLRTILSLYSMILNGYAPSRILLFGEHQWNATVRSLFDTAFPFAEVVPTDAVLEATRTAGGAALCDLTAQYWYVLKLAVVLLHPPGEFCAMDDDVVVLGPTVDALAAFAQADAVYMPDTDHGNAYVAVWGAVFGRAAPIPTRRFNTGLMWIRQTRTPAEVARLMLQGRASVSRGAWVWEQGFVATLFADSTTYELPSQQYLLPLWDGLPGGVLEYDYGRNPCRFRAIHLAGLWEKLADPAALHVAPEILTTGAGRYWD